MEKKKVQYVIQGMQRDLSVSKFNPNFAYSNLNIRITARGDKNTLLSVTNEKGNAQIPIDGSGVENNTLKGKYVGYCVISKYVVIFTAQDSISRIYRLNLNGSAFAATLLYEGNLGLNELNPVETLASYENEDIQKVYWLDGEHQPRVINISPSQDSKIPTYTDTSFDFVTKLKLKETVNISRIESGGGIFPAGVLQYAFTYFNTYGQESNIFYQSTLFYTSYTDRGGSPEDKVSNAFSITIGNIDTSFDYVRIYSIMRTSIDATPTVKRIVDIPITQSTTRVVYTDTNTTGSVEDPTMLLYIGGETIIANTFTSKDNTLFLGNIKLTRQEIGEDLANLIKPKDDVLELGFIGKTVPLSLEDGTYYTYDNQLKRKASEITTFKAFETYRIGLQFQHESGRWSEVVFVDDAANTVYPSYTLYKLQLAQGFIDIFSDNGVNTIIAPLVEKGYKKVRAVVVFPSLNERDTICQGIICPTVYNVGDRHDGTPFSQSSWFARPNLLKEFVDQTVIESGTVNRKIEASNEPTQTNWTGNILDGYIAEFRHSKPIPSDLFFNGEIRGLNTPPESPYIDSSSSSSSSWIADNQQYYFIDQSIMTLHSPEIEMSEDLYTIDLQGAQLRIVGKVLLTATATDVSLTTSNAPYNTTIGGLRKRNIGTLNVSKEGARGLLSFPFWEDALYPDHNSNTFFITYPWNSNGSVGNDGDTSSGRVTTSRLDKKKMSNLRFSLSTKYYASPWSTYVEGDIYRTGIANPQLFTSNEQEFIRVEGPNSQTFNYYGNVDKLLTFPESYNVISVNNYTFEAGTPIYNDTYRYTSNVSNVWATLSDPVSIKYKSAPHAVFAFNKTLNGDQVIAPTGSIDDTIYNKIQGYAPTEIPFWEASNANSTELQYAQANAPALPVDDDYWLNTSESKIYHYLAGKWIPIEYSVVLKAPIYYYFTEGSTTTYYRIGNDNLATPVDKSGIYQTSLPFDAEDEGYGFFWLAELYRPNVINKFGGTTKEAIENNLWLPAGEPVDLCDDNGDPLTGLRILFTEGDTYFQRYDCLKTYPYTLEDQNSVADIVSFMCETRVNIDGRYDKNRGQKSNLVMTPTNFNLTNPVYSQLNSFFNYRVLNYDRDTLDRFANVVTWTKTKTYGELTDPWTNITLASTLDMDGDKGEVRALRRFNNELYCFQDKGIAKILFNSRVQIPTSDGVPIEISNSYKVDGKIYITQDIGTINKWSIASTPSGLYFLDNLTNGIYYFNGEQFVNMADKLGFRTWIDQNNSLVEWNPKDFGNYISFYDVANSDLYFVGHGSIKNVLSDQLSAEANTSVNNPDNCLGYSELLGQFTSFYSYNDVPCMFNLGGNFYHVKNGQIWQQNAGEYNKFFGVNKPYDIQLIINPEEPNDKIFNNIEYRAASWDSEDNYINYSGFNRLDISNEYQYGQSVFEKQYNPLIKFPLQKKFMIWRAIIPRNNAGTLGNNLDRLRDTWCRLVLSHDQSIATEDTTNLRTELHDIITYYFG